MKEEPEVDEDDVPFSQRLAAVTAPVDEDDVPFAQRLAAAGSSAKKRKAKDESEDEYKPVSLKVLKSFYVCL